MPALETAPWQLVALALAAYLFGSISFGLVMARLFGLGNIREIGSGNVGTTNVLRTGSKPAAALTLIGDAGKGGVAVLVARAAFSEDAAQLCGLAAVLGHLFPVWFGFRGGKGVATYLGTLLALAWPIGLAACATWLATAAASRLSSLAALVAAALSPVWMALFAPFRDDIVLALALAVIIFLRHAGNIRRLGAGTEPRIGGRHTAGDQ